jgi:hypothetical protein
LLARRRLWNPNPNPDPPPRRTWSGTRGWVWCRCRAARGLARGCRGKNPIPRLWGLFGAPPWRPPAAGDRPTLTLTTAARRGVRGRARAPCEPRRRRVRVWNAPVAVTLREAAGSSSRGAAARCAGCGVACRLQRGAEEESLYRRLGEHLHGCRSTYGVRPPPLEPPRLPAEGCVLFHELPLAGRCNPGSLAPSGGRVSQARLGFGAGLGGGWAGAVLDPGWGWRRVGWRARASRVSNPDFLRGEPMSPAEP